jgi:hypothetical protein
MKTIKALLLKRTRLFGFTSIDAGADATNLDYHFIEQK